MCGGGWASGWEFSRAIRDPHSRYATKAARHSGSFGPGVVGGPAEQLHPAGALLLCQLLPKMAGHHSLVPAESLGVRPRPAEDLAQPHSDSLWVVGAMFANSGASSGSSGTCFS